ncbi:BrnT family toxin [Nitrosococcus wardiae]|uniref:BrnT family toxin n=1 Tax=Nitrosococcus wardiae TaxID=1814290 RepID=A0A4P7C1Y9_9GAMM|nr:BrnT family toxin [Nitrosococcus wardiae]
MPAKTVDEPRFLVIGRIKDKHWSAVITHRSERIHIISVRRSRSEEVTLIVCAPLILTENTEDAARQAMRLGLICPGASPTPPATKT